MFIFHIFELQPVNSFSLTVKCVLKFQGDNDVTDEKKRFPLADTD